LGDRSQRSLQRVGATGDRLARTTLRIRSRGRPDAVARRWAGVAGLRYSIVAAQ
jgi:hypothetical protein